jgi:hypothetical protein
LKDNAQQAEEDIICDRLDTLLLRQHSRSCSSNCDDEAVVNEAMILCKLYLLAQRNNDMMSSKSSSASSNDYPKPVIYAQVFNTTSTEADEALFRH